MTTQTETTLVRFQHNDCFITVSNPDKDLFLLTWSDGVAGHWTEDYQNLSTVFARVANLMKCGENNWDLGFRFSPEEFTENAQAFLNYATK
jgi:hypothetical protein